MAEGIRVKVNHRATVIFFDDLPTVTLHVQGRAKNAGERPNRTAGHPDMTAIKLHLLVTDGALVVGEERPEIKIYQWWQPVKEFHHVHIANGNDFLILVRAVMQSARGTAYHRSRDHVLDDGHLRIVSVVKTCHHFAVIHRTLAELEPVGEIVGNIPQRSL